MPAAERSSCSPPRTPPLEKRVLRAGAAVARAAGVAGLRKGVIPGAARRTVLASNRCVQTEISQQVPAAEFLRLRYRCFGSAVAILDARLLPLSPPSLQGPCPVSVRSGKGGGLGRSVPPQGGRCVSSSPLAAGLAFPGSLAWPFSAREVRARPRLSPNIVLGRHAPESRPGPEDAAQVYFRCPARENTERRRCRAALLQNSPIAMRP